MRDERPECGSRTDNEGDKLRLYKSGLMWRQHQITNNHVSLCQQRQDGEENSVAKENCKTTACLSMSGGFQEAGK